MTIKYNTQCTQPTILPTQCQPTHNSQLSTKNKSKLTLMPSKFQSSDGSNTFSTGRRVFLQTSSTTIPTSNTQLIEMYKTAKLYNIEANCGHLKSQPIQSENCTKNCKYVAPSKFIKTQSSDQYIQRRKNLAIGKGTQAHEQTTHYKKTPEYYSSFATSYDSNMNTVRQALRRNRNSGYVVPPKVYNNQNLHTRHCNIHN